MTGKTHASVALALSMPLVGMMEPRVLFFIPFAVYGGLVPDMDADYSLLRTARYGIFFILSAFVMMYVTNRYMTLVAVIIIVILTIAAWLTPHRTIMHSLLGMGIFSIPVLMISPKALLLFLVGYVSHLIGDYYTGDGIPLLYPKRQLMGKRLFYNNSETDKSIRQICQTVVFLIIVSSINDVLAYGGSMAHTLIYSLFSK
jgi:inner membrane protein